MKNEMQHSVKTEWLPIVLIIVSFGLGVYFYGHFPATVVSHWNLAGNPNGYSSRFVGAFTIPLLLLGLYLLFLALPYLDPRHKQYVSFAPVYYSIRNLILTALLAVYIASSLYNMGFNVNISQIVPIIIGAMLIMLGNYIGRVKANWFIGFRTPWTLSSDAVWTKTNRLGGRTLMLFGIFLILIPFFPHSIGVFLFIAGLVIAVLIPVIYSYILYSREEK